MLWYLNSDHKFIFWKTDRILPWNTTQNLVKTELKIARFLAVVEFHDHLEIPPWNTAPKSADRMSLSLSLSRHPHSSPSCQKKAYSNTYWGTIAFNYLWALKCPLSLSLWRLAWIAIEGSISGSKPTKHNSFFMSDFFHFSFVLFLRRKDNASK